MSELITYSSERIYWAVEQVEREAGDIDTLHLDDNLFYLKSDADEKIEDIVKGVVSMFRDSSRCRGLDLKSPLGRIADAAFKHWCYAESIQQKCINFEIDKEHSRQLRKQLMDRVERSEARILQQAMELRHQKYKRCLAKKDECKLRSARYQNLWEKWRKTETDTSGSYYKDYIKWWHRAMKWRNLAEEYK